MKNVIIIVAVVLIAILFIPNNKNNSNKVVLETYPWQVTILPGGRSRVFGIVLGESSLKEVDTRLKSTPKMGLFEENEKLELEAYYKNVSLGGMIGSFILTTNASEKELKAIKDASRRKKGDESNGVRYELDKPTSEKSKSLIVNNVIYIPTVQLDEKIITT